MAVESSDQKFSDLAAERARRHAAIIISSVRITSSAPTRIDLAGGTIDIWPLYLFHDGASTLNAAISLRAHAQLDSRSDSAIELQSLDTDRRVVARHWSELDPAGDLS